MRCVLSLPLKVWALFHLRIGSLQAINNGLLTNAFLTSLNLSGNFNLDGGDIAQMLSRNCTLTKLNLKSTCISAGGGSALGNALAENASLTNLNVANNKIGQGITSFARSLQTNASLKKLNLKDNNIPFHFLKDITDGLAINTSLTIIDLTCNYFGFRPFDELKQVNKNITVKYESLTQQNNVMSRRVDHDFSRMGYVMRGLEFGIFNK